MKMIDFMRWCIKFDHEGYTVIGTAKEIVIFGKLGKLVIPYGEIYNFSFSALKSRVRGLQPLPNKKDKKHEQSGSGDGGGKEAEGTGGGAGGDNGAAGGGPEAGPTDTAQVQCDNGGQTASG